MRLFDKLLKRNEKEQEQHQKHGMSSNELERASTNATRGEVKVPYPILLNIKKAPFKERYPNGLPLDVLKKINYSNFGKILKSEQLLPPSYNRIPVGVEVTASECGAHRIKLLFKSKTSASYRTISIRGYIVSMSTNNASIYYYMPIITREWENFCAKIAYLYERNWSLDFVNQIKPTDEELGL